MLQSYQKTTPLLRFSFILLVFALSADAKSTENPLIRKEEKETSTLYWSTGTPAEQDKEQFLQNQDILREKQLMCLVYNSFVFEFLHPGYTLRVNERS